MGIAYRIRQFWNLIRAKPLPESAKRNVAAILSPAELVLFEQQVAGDRMHSYRVLRTLQAAGEDDARLLAAALLHDVGKSHMKTTVVGRVIGAVGEKLFPEHAVRWGETGQDWWRRPFAIRRQHAQLGAALAEEAESDPTTVRLIRHHQDRAQVLDDPEERQLLERLQWADDQN
jgi:putative nucleotidyltransferase with HDIG domain